VERKPPLPALLVATTNPGKLREIRQLLEGVPVEITSLQAFPSVPEAEETGATFAANARQKARHYSRATGLVTVAEDSGLEIDALDGAPGVLSARFPGDTYAEKFERLFAMMDARHVTESPARFVAALAVARGDAIVYESSGTVEGVVNGTVRGSGGFGYDPILFYPPLDRTLAELSLEEKSAISHRGQAFRALRDALLRGAVPL
jgi:XTP/dITP diphosphohydrolase